MNVLMVSAELYPFAVETPAAQCLDGLAKALRQLGHEVTVAMPRHPGFEAAGLLLARRLSPLALPGEGEVTLFDGRLASGVKLVLFDAASAFDRAVVYRSGGEPCADNARRFGLLSRAVAAFVAADGRGGFDVVHGHDWPGALCAFALSRSGVARPFVLGIHDADLPRTFAFSDAGALGLPDEARDAFTVDGRLDVLLGALPSCDAVLVDSPSYARELLDSEASGRLANALAALPREVVGEAPGIDYAVYNPATDSALESRYDPEDCSNKGRSKTAMLRDMGLELEQGRPLAVALCSPGRAGGADVLVAAIPTLMKQNMTLIVSGPLEAKLDGELRDAVARYPEALGFVDAPTDATLRRLLASADISLCPARHDPMALSVRHAQRYGAVPVAHAASGVADAIVDCDAELETGTGFSFDDAVPAALVGATRRALAAYAVRSFAKLVRRVMRLDLGWDRPARRTLQVYRDAGAARS
ncbi:MAG TPA: glycogen/starch synthase [Polyangiaceae bacterium]|jgi:starch synthase